ncbi:MAG: MFS transporter [Planctomycetota bacterium]
MNEMLDTTELTIRDAKGRLIQRGMKGWLYWVCNIIETWERLAYYLLRPMAAIYICQADNPGGLHLKQEVKGFIFMWWFILQSLLPMVTGGYADRYGYKKVLYLSVTMNICGYLIMALFHTYIGFFLGVIVLATGTAFFKPGLQGTLAHLLTRKDSSLGWGTFYWIVNVGSLIGHWLSPIILITNSQEEWRILFLTCAGFTALNYIFLIFFFRDIPSGANKTENPYQTFKRTIANLFEPRLITWLLIMSCFWLMMYQLWDLQPNYIEDWVDSSMVAEYAPEKWVEQEGPMGIPRVKQQVLLSLNAFLIVVGIVGVSWMVRKMRTLSAMLIGMLMAVSGILVAGLTGNGWFLLLGIIFFSLGEMLTGPKKNEYLGLIAPPGKKGLYLGYVNIPVGIGGAFGALIAGKVYGSYGEKATLALKYLVEHAPMDAGLSWDGNADTLEQVTGIARTDAFEKLTQTLGVDGVEATRILWETYSPQYHTWIPFASIGIVAAVALYIFGVMAKRWKDMNV